MVPSSLSTSRTVRALDWALSIFSFSLNHTIRFSLSDVYSCQSFSESSNCCWLPVTRFVIITHCLVTLSSSLVALLPKFPGASSIIRWPVEQKLLYSGLWAWISFWHIKKKKINYSWQNYNTHFHTLTLSVKNDDALSQQTRVEGWYPDRVHYFSLTMYVMPLIITSWHIQ